MRSWGRHGHCRLKAIGEMKMFVNSVEEDMTSGRFVIVGTTALQLMIWLVPEFTGFNMFLYNLGLDCACIAVHDIF